MQSCEMSSFVEQQIVKFKWIKKILFSQARQQRLVKKQFEKS